MEIIPSLLVGKSPIANQSKSITHEVTFPLSPSQVLAKRALIPEYCTYLTVTGEWEIVDLQLIRNGNSRIEPKNQLKQKYLFPQIVHTS